MSAAATAPVVRSTCASTLRRRRADRRGRRSASAPARSSASSASPAAARPRRRSRCSATPGPACASPAARSRSAARASSAATERDCAACAAGSSPTCRRTPAARSTRRCGSATRSATMLRAHRRRPRSDGRCRPRWRASRCRRRRAFRRRYPHQLSGGQQQRVAIAVALVVRAARSSCSTSRRPASTSSPRRASSTSSRRLRDEDRHGDGLRVARPRGGRPDRRPRSPSCTPAASSRRGPTAEVSSGPRHPYTRGLVASIPDHAAPRRLRGIPGVAVGVGEWPPGCAFAPRCAHAGGRCCAGVPALEQATDAARGALRPLGGADAAVERRPRAAPASRPLPRATRRCSRSSGLHVRVPPRQHRRRRGRRLVRRPPGRVRRAGRRVGQRQDDRRPRASPACTSRRPGGSCSTAQPLAGLGRGAAPPTSAAGSRSSSRTRPTSLNPRHRVRSSIARPLRVLRGLGTPRRRRREVGRLLERVRLPGAARRAASRSSSPAASASASRSPARSPRSPTCWSATR